MTAQVRYTNGALMAYSCTHSCRLRVHLAFNGSKGGWSCASTSGSRGRLAVDEIRLSRNFGTSEVIPVEWGKGGHFGGDPALKDLLFHRRSRTPTNRGRVARRRHVAAGGRGGVAQRGAEATVRIDSLIKL